MSIQDPRKLIIDGATSRTGREMSFAARVKQTLQSIDIAGRETILYRCDACDEALDPAADADIGYECTTCGAVLGKRPQVCLQCTRYTFECVDIRN